ncbi:MAG: 30S ribosomal protein S12 methylthiotransferase RimO [Deltaproteobacteria bacterium]|nr:30S ribosomal protein S12 methylthiotransferase RimO [Deltaproteobacteria bacterium]
MKAKKKIGMISLGCPKNLVDSEVMLGMVAQENDLEITGNQDDADIMIVNTCAFIEDSKKESIDTILEVAQLKEDGKLQKLIVAGCLAQRYKAKLERELPEVDHFIGTGEFQHITKFLKASQGLPLAKSQVAKPEYVYDYATPRISTLPPHTAYVKIAEGCSRTCSFCIIPRLRGPNRSRSIESIVKEAQHLAQHGAKEISLIAQDLTAYGLERDDDANLVKLLRALVEIEGLVWIRLMYNYPMYFSDELVELIAHEPKICSYLDIPLQHIDADLLKSMDRKVDEQETYVLLKKLRDKIPGLILRTGMIVGFPGETRAQFEKLKDFITDIEFDRLGVFTYSQEEGTKAATMPDQINEEIKHARKEELMLLQQEISSRRNKSWIGKELDVLIDHSFQHEGQNVHVGRFEGQALDIDGNVQIFHQNLPIGEFVKAKIINATEYDLIAEVL